MHTKSQSASEFLILFSILFIIIGIIAFVFLDFTNIGLYNKEQESAIYWQSTDIQIMGYEHEGSMLMLLLKNTYEQSVLITNMTINGELLNMDAFTLEPYKETQMLLPHTVNDNAYELTILFSFELHNRPYTFTGEVPLYGRVADNIFSEFFGFIYPTPLNQKMLSGDILNITHYSYSQKNVSVVLNFNDSLVSWWRMDDVEGNTVIDYMGIHNGTINGGVQINSGKIGDAVLFNASQNQRIIVSHSTDFNLQQGGTLVAWINPTNLGHSDARILEKANSAGADDGFRFRYNPPNNRVGFRINYDNNVDSEINSVHSNVWSHVAVTFTEEGLVRLYVNGVQSSSGMTGNASTITSENNLAIGNRASNYIRPFDGLIDDVMVFNKVLTPNEISSLYLSQAPRYDEFIFTDLSVGNYTFEVFTQNTKGEVFETPKRMVSIE